MKKLTVHKLVIDPNTGKQTLSLYFEAEINDGVPSVKGPGSQDFLAYVEGGLLHPINRELVRVGDPDFLDSVAWVLRSTQEYEVKIEE